MPESTAAARARMEEVRMGKAPMTTAAIAPTNRAKRCQAAGARRGLVMMNRIQITRSGDALVRTIDLD